MGNAFLLEKFGEFSTLEGVRFKECIALLDDSVFFNK